MYLKINIGCTCYDPDKPRATLRVLNSLGFGHRIKGSHHIYYKDGIDEIIIYRSEDDKSFIAEVPELAGCMADGKNPVEAVQNAMVAIEEWIETAKELGRLIPEPRDKLMYA